ncbi:MAG: hypothetical protein PVH62_08985 [Anaerolineae bacterium]|jgi:hypothetical protein
MTIIRRGRRDPAHKRGTLLLYGADVRDQEEFRGVLHRLRRQWRDWHIVVCIGRGSPHAASVAGQLARELAIELRWSVAE